MLPCKFKWKDYQVVMIQPLFTSIVKLEISRNISVESIKTCHKTKWEKPCHSSSVGTSFRWLQIREKCLTGEDTGWELGKLRIHVVDDESTRKKPMNTEWQLTHLLTATPPLFRVDLFSCRAINIFEYVRSKERIKRVFYFKNVWFHSIKLILFRVYQ